MPEHLCIRLRLQPAATCQMTKRHRRGWSRGEFVAGRTFFSRSGVLCPVLTGWLAGAGRGFAPAFTALCVVVGSGVLGMICFAKGRGPIPEDPI